MHTLPEFGEPIKGWSYKTEENKEFYLMYQALILELQERLRHSEWCDIFGEIYEEVIVSKSRRSNSGQFFTPPSICNFMTEVCSPKKLSITRKRILDPTCGSGRNLLAFHVKHLGNYIVGEDIDRTCAMMTVCNFILHGVQGEVIWHNALLYDSYYGGWKVNEYLNSSLSEYRGIPHCRPMKREESVLFVDSETKTKERIRMKLDKCLSNHAETRTKVLNSGMSSEEKERQATAITRKIKNIIKLKKKYQ